LYAQREPPRATRADNYQIGCGADLRHIKPAPRCANLPES
jgi:hypothetical protein